MTTNIDTLVTSCLMLTEKEGKILFKRSTAFGSTLRMEYEGDGLHVEFSVKCSAFEPGSVYVKVKQNRKTVFEITRQYEDKEYSSVQSCYVPGDWEKRVRL